MSLPQVVSRDEWLAARTELLAEEKAMIRARDALNIKRRELPMVRIDKEYIFEGPDGKVGLGDHLGNPSFASTGWLGRMARYGVGVQRPEASGLPPRPVPGMADRTAAQRGRG